MVNTIFLRPQHPRRDANHGIPALVCAYVFDQRDFEGSPMANSTAPEAALVRHSTTVGIREWMRPFAFGALWMSTLFLGAGTLRWVRGWLFATVYFGSVAIAVLAVHHWNPDLMEARLRVRHKDTKHSTKSSC